MFLIDDILMSPVNFTVWLAKKIKDQAEKELYDVEALKEALEELRERYEAREVSLEEFQRREDRLLKTLQEARERQKAKTEAKEQ